MGYSCTKAADETLREIERVYQSPGTKSQVMRINGHDYFFERGKENPDGAITGTLYRFDSLVSDSDATSNARKAGSVRIEADGSISRFPGLNYRQKDVVSVGYYSN